MVQNMKIFTTSIIVWFNCLTTSDTANILAIFPSPSKSHLQFHAAIMRSLHDAGHNITFMSSFSDDEAIQNFTTINAKWDTILLSAQFSIYQYRGQPGSKYSKFVTNVCEKLCESVLQLHEMQRLFNSTSKEYDIMFIQMTTMHECLLPMAEKLNIPIIGTATWPSLRRADTSIGVPSNPSVIPQDFGEYNDQMTFFQRLKNTWEFLVMEYDYYFTIRPKLNKIYAKYYSQDLLYKKKISLLFYNNHPSIFPRISVPNAIDVGGIHVKPNKSLPEDLREFIDSAKYGVILFTLGSIADSKTMSSEMVTSFTEAFARIPQRVIWKYSSKIENVSENVLLINWVPQRDILAHKNIKAFITHCGLSGVQEAIYEAVPLILTPLFSDQNINAAFLEKLGVGIRLDIFTTTPDTILQALNAVINDKKYRENMKQLSRIFKDRPMTPQQSVVYWTEYVIRHNGALHLRTSGADMPFFRYFLLDIILFVTAIATIVAFIVGYLLRKVRNLFLKYSKSMSVINNKKTI